MHYTAVERDETLSAPLSANSLYRPRITPPIRKIPVEILIEIFLSCAAPKKVQPQLSQVPWSLSHVCSMWRRVSLDTPNLWTDITLCSESRHGWNIQMAIEHFRRSRHLPVSLHACSSSVIPPPGFVELMTSTIYSKRLCELDISGDHSWILPLLSSPRIRFQDLQRLTLDSDPYHFNIFNLLLVRGVNSLREFVLKGITLTLKSLFQLSLHNLTLLHMPSSELGPRATFAALTHCVSLVDCVISITQMKGDVPIQSDELEFMTLALPQLEKLILIVSGEMYCVSFIPRLTLPRLTEFSISVSEPSPTSLVQWEDWYWNPEFTPALTRSGRLTSLGIHIPILPADLDDILSKLPHLSTLDLLDSGTIPQSVLDKMACRSLVPSLLILRCQLNPAVLDMLDEMKCIPASTLPHIREVMLGGPIPRDGGLSISRIRSLNDQGLNVTYRAHQ